MTQKTPIVYPGLLCHSTEFFNIEGSVKAIQGGKIKDFTDLSFATIQILKEEIDKSPQVKEALNDFHPTSDIKRVEQFVKCRFGGLDFNPDIKDNTLQDGEYWPCTEHGNCPHEGVLCKLPKINDHRLTKTEVHYLQLQASDMTNDVIAQEMNMPLGSLHLLKKKIYSIFKIQTKQEATILSKELNII